MNDIKDALRDIASGQDLERKFLETRQELEKQRERAAHYQALSLELGKKLLNREAEARTILAGLTDEERKQRLDTIWKAI